MEISGKRVAVFAEKLYEELELWYPYYRLKEAGATVSIIGSGTSKDYTGKYGYPVTVDMAINEVSPDDFDAVIIPGGYSPDFMRRSLSMVAFIKEMYAQGKIVAAICHGPWMLVSADILKGKTATCFFAINDDLRNSGATVIDVPVARDGTIITSRTPADLPNFCRTIIEALAGA